MNNIIVEQWTRVCAIAVALGLLLISVSSAVFAQSIRTVAGGGTDDGRPATVAGLSYPSGLAVDSAGNLYITDSGNYRIRKVAAGSGIIMTVAGIGSFGFSGDGGAATAAELNSPSGLALDSAGNLYFADAGNNRVRKVASGSGIITTVAGNGSLGLSGDGGAATLAQLADPTGVALDPTGNLYIADNRNDRIRKVAAGSGIITTVAGNGSLGFSGDGGAATAAEFSLSDGPSGMALDSAVNLYVADGGNHRIRKIAAGSGIITTVAGNGSQGFSGDGGAATAAGLNYPAGVALDSAGNLYVADGGNGRIRRIETGNGIITTVAGNGSEGVGGDGGVATAAQLRSPAGVALDLAGNLHFADFYDGRIRKVAAGSGIITTVAGNGSSGFLGDGGAATAAGLHGSYSVTIDSVGNLFIADYEDNRIRKVTAGSRIITTVAGNGAAEFSGDGGAASAAGLFHPYGVFVDAARNLYIADTDNQRIRKVSAETKIITTVAGNGSAGFSGDGGAATAAAFFRPFGVTTDAVGNLYIADSDNHRIRRVAAGSGIVATIAGNGSEGFSGDGGPATAAGLSYPYGVTFDSEGNLCIADLGNHRIRKVAMVSGIITTVAGSGSLGSGGDGGAATAAGLAGPSGVAVDLIGNLYIGDISNHRVRKVAAGSGIITAVAGNGSAAFSGDGGVATAAGLPYPSGVALDVAGNLYIADTIANRVRVVLACVTVPRPDLTVPSNGELGVSDSAKLAWSPVKGAFTYDVYLDTTNPPQKFVAADVSAPLYGLSNLEPLATYYWKIVAKGDPFCVPFSSASSAVYSFTTQGSCSAPGAFSGTVSGTAITWQTSERASSYDLYLSTSNPPRIYTSGLTELSMILNGLAPGTIYSWKVVAHAACDNSQVAETSIGSFTTQGVCGTAGTFALTDPNDGEATVPASATLIWSASPGAASYDLYLGSGSNPPLYLSDLAQTSVVIPLLSPGSEYSWKVVAKAACDPAKSVASPVRRFTVSACGTPPNAPTLIMAQSTSPAGATYTIRWNEAASLDAGGSYLVERATDAAFNNIADRQQTTATRCCLLRRAPERFTTAFAPLRAAMPRGAQRRVRACK